MKIVEYIRSLDPPGRFLKRDETTNLWNDVGEKKAIEKTRQALREKAPELAMMIPKETERMDAVRIEHSTTCTIAIDSNLIPLIFCFPRYCESLENFGNHDLQPCSCN